VRVTSSEVPVVAAISMGYGHLRAGLAVAQALGTSLVRADEAPVAGLVERLAWGGAHGAYDLLSRRAARRDPLATRLLEGITAIPADDAPQRAPDAAARATALIVGAGFGRGLVRLLTDRNAGLVATYFTLAHSADRAGQPAWLVVTDVDCARSWVPPDPAAGHIVYLAPTERVATRLRGYGVPDARIALTGFPLPPALARRASQDLAGRLDRLRSGAPLRLLLAIGGAGAQVDRVAAILAAARGAPVEITVSAGTRPEVGRRVEAAAQRAGVGVRVVFGDTFEAYAEAFDRAVADTDVLWTKPSELAFFAALGVPLAPAPPVGVQEERNLAWLRAHGAAFDELAPDALIPALLAGRASLAEMAVRAYEALPRDGADRIADLVAGERRIVAG
jgi:hypothetical protein